MGANASNGSDVHPSKNADIINGTGVSMMRRSDPNQGEKHPPEADWDLSLVIAHRIAIRCVTKKALRQQFKELRLIPYGGGDSFWWKMWDDAFRGVLKLHPKWHGSYELKDEMWTHIDPEAFPYRMEKERENARKRKSEYLHPKRPEFLNDDPSNTHATQSTRRATEQLNKSNDGPSSPVPNIGTKRPPSSSLSGELLIKKLKMDDATHSFTVPLASTSNPAAMGATYSTSNQNHAEVSSAPAFRQCGGCRRWKPLTSGSFRRKAPNGDFYAQCIVCHQRALSNRSRTRDRHVEAGPKAASVPRAASVPSETSTVESPVAPRPQLVVTLSLPKHKRNGQPKDGLPSPSLSTALQELRDDAGMGGSNAVLNETKENYAEKLSPEQNTLREKVERLTAEKLAVVVSRGELQRQISDLEEENWSLSRSIEDKDAIIAEHETNLTEARSRNEVLTNEIENLTRAASEIPALLERLKGENEVLVENLAKAKEEVERLTPFEKKYEERMREDGKNFLTARAFLNENRVNTSQAQ
ncbi:hypothetical protein EG329_001638 [Mollisiaceae sp. DMI_Dod_QoI]|nr:hypothetical protein EG329_001638 [Helotiales sp. DMI_Dod_QoI]